MKPLIINISPYVKEKYLDIIVLDKVPEDLYDKIIKHHNFRSDLGDVVLIESSPGIFKGRLTLRRRA